MIHVTEGKTRMKARGELIPGHSLIDKTLGKASTRSGVIQYVADGTDEVHVAIMPVSRHESGASRFWSLQTRLKGGCAIPVRCAPELAPFVDVRCGRWRRVSAWRRRAVLGQFASHIRGRGEVRHGSTGESVWRSGDGVPVWEPPMRICVQDG